MKQAVEEAIREALPKIKARGWLHGRPYTSLIEVDDVSPLVDAVMEVFQGPPSEVAPEDQALANETAPPPEVAELPAHD